MHVVKCLSCSMTNWFLVVDCYRINTSFLRIIRETEPLSTQMRRVLPLKAVKQRDRMRSQTPREISSKSVWDLFPCKHVCEGCKWLPQQAKCNQFTKADHDSNFCQHHVVSLLVPEKWRLSEDNEEGRIEQPQCICRGPPSTFFVCTKSVVYSVGLHNPVQVKVASGTLEMVSCIT